MAGPIHRRSRGLITPAIVAIVVFFARTAGAYVSTGSDPRGDATGPAKIADIVATSRAVWRNDEGRRWLKVAFHTDRRLRSATLDVEVRIDSRGDRRTHHLISFFIDGSRKACNMGKAIAPLNRTGHSRMFGRFASCNVPLAMGDTVEANPVANVVATA
jgi:hypothetical protein